MPNPPLPDELAIEAFQAWCEHGAKTTAANALGIPRGTFENRLRAYYARGLDKRYGDFVKSGYVIKSEGQTVNAAGEVVSTSIKTEREGGGQYKVPDGYAIKGESTLLDGDGNVRAQWVKTDRTKRDPDEIIASVKSAFESFKPTAPNLILPKEALSDRLTVYPILDWHIGMLARAKSTNDENWNLKKSKRVILQNFAEVVQSSPASENAIFMCLGDILHADSSSQTTPNSGNKLDVDGRHSKVLETACDLILECSELVASKHKNVEMTFKRGNHDEDSTAALRHAMRLVYRNHKRISVDTTDYPFYFRAFGRNLLGGTHGDKQKLTDLPMVMANAMPKEWAKTTTRHFFTGHVHHDNWREIGGVRCMTLRAPIPSDAYHASVGYSSGRSIYAFQYHSELGSKGINEVEIK